MRKFLFIISLMPVIGFAQTSKKDSLWMPFKNLAGDWEGMGEGVDGNGEITVSFNFIFGNRYLEMKNKSVYPPKEGEKVGYVHEDIGYISYDSGRKKFIFRQFHIEGFVNQYVLESISTDGKTIVFITEQIENLPAGWKAKETFQVTSGNEFTEIFELAEPGKDFTVYSKTVFKKK